MTFTIVPAGLAARLGNDRDGDGVFDGLELAQGSSPADASSKSLAPVQGLWFNPVRSGSEPFEVLMMSTDRTLRNYTGTWYDPGDPGWGATFYVQGDVRVTVLYFYDADNQPRWALGQGNNSAAGLTEMLSFTGFCPDCERIDPVFVGAGQVDVTFDDERSGSFTSTTGFPGLADSDWVRTEVDFVSLSDAWRDPALD